MEIEHSSNEYRCLMEENLVEMPAFRERRDAQDMNMR